MRELLNNATAIEIAQLAEHELAATILAAMQQRAKKGGGGGMPNRQTASEEIFAATVNTVDMTHQQRSILLERLRRAFTRAFDSLLRDRLIEPDAGLNGTNGYIVLTPEGRTMQATPADMSNVRIRTMITPDMIHLKLRDKPYRDLQNGDLGSAVFEAFKVVEIEVRAAASMPKASGQNLMLQAFDAKAGPLTDMAEQEPARNALARLFAGAMGRFRNDNAHTNAAYPDPMVAIEELLLASRLLRFLDEPSRVSKKPNP